MAIQWVGVMFARCRTLTGLLIVLAALLVLPIPAASHQIGDNPHPDDCHTQGYDLCHSPRFSQPPIQFDIPVNKGPNHDVGPLPIAWDWDHQNDANPTMVYSLRDGDATVMDNDEELATHRDGDARFFYIYK